MTLCEREHERLGETSGVLLFEGCEVKGSRHARGYGSAWDRIRLVALERDQGQCVLCSTDDSPTLAEEVDHIVPKKQGGSDDLSNLQSLCRPCHAAKTAADEGKRHRPRPRIGLDGWPIP